VGSAGSILLDEADGGGLSRERPALESPVVEHVYARRSVE
jgi:hypothetical protein